MKKMMNRTLAVMLAVAMLISNVEMGVYAEELGKVQSLEQVSVQTLEQESGQVLPDQGA